MRRLMLPLALLLAVPTATAQADTRITFADGRLTLTSEDAAVANRLAIEPATRDGRAQVRFADEADTAGISTFPTGRCAPGRVNAAGNPTEVLCARDGVRALVVDLGPDEDRATSALADLPTTLGGALGADALRGGAGTEVLAGDQGDDTLEGGAGADQLEGGEGTDVLEGGEGDDALAAADGFSDQVRCGAGTDTATVDQLDVVTDCEQVVERTVAPPPGAPVGVVDRSRPVLRVGGATAQRVTRTRRTVVFTATSSERGVVQATGFLDAGGQNDRLAPASAAVEVGGGGVELAVRLTAAQARRVVRDRRRGRRPRVRLVLAAVDAAGNTSRARRVTIVLRG